MSFFVELTEGAEAASSKKTILDAFTVVSFRAGEGNRGTDLLVNDGDYKSGGKTVHVQETPAELLSMTLSRVPFVAFSQIEHKEKSYFPSEATGTAKVFFNAAAVTNLIPSAYPVPGNVEPPAGESTIIQLSSGKRAHVNQKPSLVISSINNANAP